MVVKPDALPAGTAPLPTPRQTAERWADLTTVTLDCDQLGLANPACFTLLAAVPGRSPIRLEADPAGIYRPSGFRPAPWSGFAYDQSPNGATGIAAGARISTARGEIEVERLVPGDTVITQRGPTAVPISWIGRSTAAIPPIRIEPGALGLDRPRHILHLGPDQPVHLHPTSIDQAPVAARTLVNGTTIREDGAVKPDLFHIDIGRADALLAEGLALSSSTVAREPG